MDNNYEIFSNGEYFRVKKIYINCFGIKVWTWIRDRHGNIESSINVQGAKEIINDDISTDLWKNNNWKKVEEK